MAQKKDNIIQLVRADLQSSDLDKVLNALENVRSVGKAELVPDLIHLLTHEQEAIQLEAERIICSLKDTASIPYLIDALDDPRYTNVRFKLISAFWQAGLDASPYLNKMIQIAANGSFLDCMECYSVVTNIEPEDLPHDQVMESIITLNTYLEKAKPDQKTELLRDMLTLLNEA